MLDKIKEEFNFQINNFPYNDLLFIINIIEEKKNNNIYFTGIGKSFNIALHLNDLIKSIGLKSFVLDSIKALHGDIGTLKSNDIIFFFSNSGNTNELIPVINKCNSLNVYTIGICCNKNSKFMKLCNKTLVLPFRAELEYNNISSIPTNSCMIQLIFSNIIVLELIKKFDIKLSDYKLNHPAGSIGKNLKSLKECLLANYPKFNIEKNKSILLNNILLEMTSLNCGISIFVNNDDRLLGILLDGDIRRLILKNNDIKFITSNEINKNYIFETNINKPNKLMNKKLKYIPILNNNEDKKIIGISKLN